MRILVTDLTRFQNADIVCLAGVTPDGHTVRPYPLLSTQRVRREQIRPGHILEGDFKLKDAPLPHVEDAAYTRLAVGRTATRGEMLRALRSTLQPGVSPGFGIALPRGETFVPEGRPPPVRSLITIKIMSTVFQVVASPKTKGKFRIDFWDETGVFHELFPITDLLFLDRLAAAANIDRELAEFNSHLHKQSEIYLRVGLGRLYDAGNGRRGYWCQVNGIYSFPEPPPHLTWPD